MATNTEKIVVQVVVKGQKDLDRLSKKSGTATKQTGGLTKSLAKMTGQLVAAATIFRTLSSAITSSIITFKNFEFQMAKVRAITGSSDTQFKALIDSARELGRTTFFTATQVGELQTNFAKLGFTTSEILLAQEATLALATATDTDLARAAVVAGAAVRGFGLDASETGRVTDVMALSFTSSAMDIEKFQTSMTKVAPIAAAANISIEATVAVMSKLTDVGIEASIAGTSLRQIFLKMQDSTSDLSKFLGFTVNSSEDLQKALDKLNEAGLSNEQVMGLVETRQVAAFNVMIRGAEDIANMTTAFNEANGELQIMVDIIEDTLEGDLKKLTSATSDLQTEVGGRLSPKLRELTQDFTKFTTKLIENADAVVEVSRKFGNLILNITPLVRETKAGIEVLNKSINLITGNKGWRAFTDMIGLTGVKADTSTADRIDEMNLAFEKTLGLTSLNKKNTSDNIEVIKKEISTRKEQIKSIEDANEIFGETTSLLFLKKPISSNIGASQLQKEVEELEKSLLVREDLLFEFNETEKERLKDKAASDQKIQDRKDDLADAAATKKRNKELRDEREALEIKYRNSENKLKESLISTELTQEAFDEKSFLNEQQRLDDLKKILIEYNEDTSEVSKQIFDNELEQIAIRTAAELDSAKQIGNAFKLQYNEDVSANKEKNDKIIQMAKQSADMLFKIFNNNLSNRTERDKKALEEKNDAGIISQQQYEAGILEIERTAFEKKKKLDIAQAIINGALAMTKTAAALGPLVFTFSPFIAAMTAAQIAIIQSQKFALGGMIEEFANGGLVHGKSHAQGGEKFSVGGRVVELEGGEAVINKRSTAMFSSQLSAMNSAGGGVKFADGGLLNQPSFGNQQFNAIGQNQMINSMNNSSKVVVVESDITESQNTVSVIQSQATI